MAFVTCYICRQGIDKAGEYTSTSLPGRYMCLSCAQVRACAVGCEANHRHLTVSDSLILIKARRLRVNAVAEARFDP
jgi:hypothetical protein